MFSSSSVQHLQCAGFNSFLDHKSSSSSSTTTDWTHSMQDAAPHRAFYVIKLHDLKGSFSAVPAGQREKLWQKFFLDPSQWWDHRADKVTEHQSCQSSHVNIAIAVNLVVPLLLFCLGLKLAKKFLESFALVGY